MGDMVEYLWCTCTIPLIASLTNHSVLIGKVELFFLHFRTNVRISFKFWERWRTADITCVEQTLTNQSVASTNTKRRTTRYVHCFLTPLLTFGITCIILSLSKHCRFWWPVVCFVKSHICIPFTSSIILVHYIITLCQRYIQNSHFFPHKKWWWLFNLHVACRIFEYLILVVRDGFFAITIYVVARQSKLFLNMTYIPDFAIFWTEVVFLIKL